MRPQHEPPLMLSVWIVSAAVDDTSPRLARPSLRRRRPEAPLSDRVQTYAARSVDRGSGFRRLCEAWPQDRRGRFPPAGASLSRERAEALDRRLASVRMRT